MVVADEPFKVRHCLAALTTHPTAVIAIAAKLNRPCVMAPIHVGRSDTSQQSTRVNKDPNMYTYWDLGLTKFAPA